MPRWQLFFCFLLISSANVNASRSVVLQSRTLIIFFLARFPPYSLLPLSRISSCRMSFVCRSNGAHPSRSFLSSNCISKTTAASDFHSFFLFSFFTVTTRPAKRTEMALSNRSFGGGRIVSICGERSNFSLIIKKSFSQKQ